MTLEKTNMYNENTVGQDSKANCTALTAARETKPKN